MTVDHFDNIYITQGKTKGYWVLLFIQLEKWSDILEFKSNYQHSLLPTYWNKICLSVCIWISIVRYQIDLGSCWSVPREKQNDNIDLQMIFIFIVRETSLSPISSFLFEIRFALNHMTEQKVDIFFTMKRVKGAADDIYYCYVIENFFLLPTDWASAKSSQ